MILVVALVCAETRSQEPSPRQVSTNASGAAPGVRPRLPDLRGPPPGSPVANPVEDPCAPARAMVTEGQHERALVLLEERLAAGDGCAAVLLVATWRATHRHGAGVARADALLAGWPRDRALSVELSLLLAEAGQVQRGLACLDAALRLHPTDATLLAQRGRLRLALADLTGAEADARQALAGGLRTTGVLTLLATVLAQSAQPEAAQEAAILLDIALDLDPNASLAHLERARLALRAGDTARALEHAWRCLEHAPRQPGALQTLARAAREAGDVELARSALAAFARANEVAEREKDCRQSVASNPDNVLALRALARFLVEAERAEEARPLIARLSAGPQGGVAAEDLLLRARLARMQQRPRDALMDLQAALRRDGALDAARLELAELALAAGLLDLAAQALARSEGKVDRRRWLLSCAELAARRREPFSNAARHLEQLLEIAPGDAEAVLAMVDIAIGAGAQAQAREFLETCAVRGLGAPMPRIGLAELALLGGQLEQAGIELALAEAEAPRSAALHAALARWHAACGRREATVEHARAARRSRILEVARTNP